MPSLTMTPTSRLLAPLADDVPVDARRNGVSPSDATEWFQRNKFPLLAIGTRAPAWLLEDQIFQVQMAAEREWYQTQRNEYLLVRQAWLERGITCLMIKSAGNAPSFPYMSDNIDIAVRPEHGQAARDILRRLGYVEVRSVEEPRKFLFRKFHAGRCVSAIHVHECVGWGVGFMDEDALWARMRPADDDPLVNIPSPEDAILINLAHACYENKRLRLVDLARVRYVLRTAGETLDWDDMRRVAAARGWLDGLAFLVLVYAWLEPALFGSSLVPEAQQARFARLIEGDTAIRWQLAALRARSTADLPLLLDYWFCKRLYYRKVLRDPALSLGQRWRDVGATLAWGIKLKSRLHPQHGAVISLSGPDGSGKTAHAQALVEALRLCEIQTDYVWSRAGSTGLLAITRPLVRVARAVREAGGVDDPVERRRRRLAAAGPLARFGWAWLVALDQAAFYNLRARLPTLVGRVVVCDRYAYDAAVDMDWALPTDARWSRLAIAAMLELVPRPELAYLLDVSAAAARERKPDEPWHADFEGERRRYRVLADRLDLRVLSNDGEFAAASDELIRDAIMAYMARIETWLKSMFRANPSQLNRPDLVWARGGAR